MKRQSVKKNYIYNVIYNLFLIIVPLIVTPHVARAITATGTGQYSFSLSLTNYFLLFGAFGFSIYGQRFIARIQGDKYKQTLAFWEINICRLIPVLIALMVDGILIITDVYGDYTILMSIMFIQVAALSFDIAYFFQGNEEFSKLIIRNFVIKIISIILILLYVNKPGDLTLYAIINVGSVVLSNLSLWGYLRKYLVKINIKELNPFRHFKGTLILFIPTIALSIYLILDKTLIGLLVDGTYIESVDGVDVIKKYSDLENGYYEQAEKLVKMAMTIITCIGTVMVPRNSNELAKGNIEGVRSNLRISQRLVFLIGLPMSIGFIAISSKIIPWYLGEGYYKSEYLMMILAPLILIIGLSNVYGNQYMIPSGNEKYYMISLFIGGFVNLILNLILIPHLYSYGAAIATIIAEFIITIIMSIIVRKEVNIFKGFIDSWKYVVAAGVMFIILWHTKNLFISSSVWITFILIFEGFLIYFLIVLLLKDELVINVLKKVIRFLFSKVCKRKENINAENQTNELTENNKNDETNPIDLEYNLDNEIKKSIDKEQKK